MPSRIRQTAVLSTARGCGFAGLAIVTAMLGFAHDPPAALKFGGYASLLTCFVLILMGLRATSTPYKRTEIWLLLEKHERPPAAFAQQVIGTVRRDVLLRFARFNGAIALVCFVGSFLLRAALG